MISDSIIKNSIMKKVVLISCASKKKKIRSKAINLYNSSLFKLNLDYAKTFEPDLILILSAKFGVLELQREIETYNISLNNMKVEEKRKWTATVVNKLKNYCDLKVDHFIILAGMNYREYLIEHLFSYEIPLKNLTIGKQLQFLKRALS